MNSREHTHNILFGEDFEFDGIPEIIEANYGNHPNFSSPKHFSRSAPRSSPRKSQLAQESISLSNTSEIIFDFDEGEVEVK